MYVDIANLDIETVDEYDLREEIHYWLNKEQCRIVRRYDGMNWYSDDMPFKEAVKLESLGIEYYEDDDSQGWIPIPFTVEQFDEAIELLEILEG